MGAAGALLPRPVRPFPWSSSRYGRTTTHACCALVFVRGLFGADPPCADGGSPKSGALVRSGSFVCLPAKRGWLGSKVLFRLRRQRVRTFLGLRVEGSSPVDGAIPLPDCVSASLPPGWASPSDRTRAGPHE